MHLTQLEAVGLGRGTREHEMFRLDALGQVILLGVAGRFPFLQGEFVRTCSEMASTGDPARDAAGVG